VTGLLGQQPREATYHATRTEARWRICIESLTTSVERTTAFSRRALDPGKADRFARLPGTPSDSGPYGMSPPPATREELEEIVARAADGMLKWMNLLRLLGLPEDATVPDVLRAARGFEADR
jgi:hypothetical protein